MAIADAAELLGTGLPGLPVESLRAVGRTLNARLRRLAEDEGQLYERLCQRYG